MNIYIIDRNTEEPILQYDNIQKAIEKVKELNRTTQRRFWGFNDAYYIVIEDIE